MQRKLKPITLDNKQKFKMYVLELSSYEERRKRLTSVVDKFKEENRNHAIRLITK